MSPAHRPIAIERPADDSAPSRGPDDGTAESTDRRSARELDIHLDRSAGDSRAESDGPSLAHPGPDLAAELERARLEARVEELESRLAARQRRERTIIDGYERALRAREDETQPERADDGWIARLQCVLGLSRR